MDNLRTTEAIWDQSKSMWRCRVKRNGEPRYFYSPTPGTKGKLESERKADAWLADVMSSDMAFDIAWDAFIEYRKAHASKDCFLKEESLGRLYVKPALKKKPLSRIVGQDWQNAVLMGADNDLSRRSCLNIRSTIASFVLHCEMQGITVCPPKRIMIPKSAPVGERHILQPPDLKTLFTSDTISRYGRNIPCHFIHAWRFLVMTGLRRGELCGLQQSDLEGNALFLKRSINAYNDETPGKTDAARRYVALSARALDILDAQKEMLKRRGIISPWLFPDEYGECLEPNHLYRTWRTYRKQHGIKCTLHELRHTFVSLVKVDMPESLIRSMVGHVDSMDTFGVYAHRVDSDIDRAAAIIDDVFSRLI